MQEDVENKTVNLAVKSSKVTATVLYKALRAFINHQKRKHWKSKWQVRNLLRVNSL